MAQWSSALLIILIINLLSVIVRSDDTSDREYMYVKDGVRQTHQRGGNEDSGESNTIVPALTSTLEADARERDRESDREQRSLDQKSDASSCPPYLKINSCTNYDLSYIVCDWPSPSLECQSKHNYTLFYRKSRRGSTSSDLNSCEYETFQDLHSQRPHDFIESTRYNYEFKHDKELAENKCFLNTFDASNIGTNYKFFVAPFSGGSVPKNLPRKLDKGYVYNYGSKDVIIEASPEDLKVEQGTSRESQSTTNSNSIKLSWGAPPTPYLMIADLKYMVEYRLKSEGKDESATATSNPWHVIDVPENLNSIEVSGLARSATFEFKVKTRYASNNANLRIWSKPSEILSARIEEDFTVLEGERDGHEFFVGENYKAEDTRRTEIGYMEEDNEEKERILAFKAVVLLSTLGSFLLILLIVCFYSYINRDKLKRYAVTDIPHASIRVRLGVDDKSLDRSLTDPYSKHGSNGPNNNNNGPGGGQGTAPIILTRSFSNSNPHRSSLNPLQLAQSRISSTPYSTKNLLMRQPSISNHNRNACRSLNITGGTAISQEDRYRQEIITPDNLNLRNATTNNEMQWDTVTAPLVAHHHVNMNRSVTSAASGSKVSFLYDLHHPSLAQDPTTTVGSHYPGLPGPDCTGQGMASVAEGMEAYIQADQISTTAVVSRQIQNVHFSNQDNRRTGTDTETHKDDHENQSLMPLDRTNTRSTADNEGLYSQVRSNSENVNGNIQTHPATHLQNTSSIHSNHRTESSSSSGYKQNLMIIPNHSMAEHLAQLNAQQQSLASDQRITSSTLQNELETTTPGQPSADNRLEPTNSIQSPTENTPFTSGLHSRNQTSFRMQQHNLDPEAIRGALEDLLQSKDGDFNSTGFPSFEVIQNFKRQQQNTSYGHSCLTSTSSAEVLVGTRENSNELNIKNPEFRYHSDETTTESDEINASHEELDMVPDLPRIANIKNQRYSSESEGNSISNASESEEISMPSLNSSVLDLEVQAEMNIHVKNHPDARVKQLSTSEESLLVSNFSGKTTTNNNYRRNRNHHQNNKLSSLSQFSDCSSSASFVRRPHTNASMDSGYAHELMQQFLINRQNTITNGNAVNRRPALDRRNSDESRSSRSSDENLSSSSRSGTGSSDDDQHHQQQQHRAREILAARSHRMNQIQLAHEQRNLILQRNSHAHAFSSVQNSGTSSKISTSNAGNSGYILNENVFNNGHIF